MSDLTILENYPVKVPSSIKTKPICSHYLYYVPIATGLILIFLNFLLIDILFPDIRMNFYIKVISIICILPPLTYVFYKVRVYKLHIIRQDRLIKDELPLFLIIVELLSSSGLTILSSIKSALSLDFFTEIKRSLSDIKRIDDTHVYMIKSVISKKSPLLRDIVISITECKQNISLWIKRLLHEIKIDLKKYADVVSILHKSLLLIISSTLVIPALTYSLSLIESNKSINYIFSEKVISSFVKSHVIFCLLVLFSIIVIYTPIILVLKPNYRKLNFLRPSLRVKNYSPSITDFISSYIFHIQNGRSFEEIIKALRTRKFDKDIDAVIEELYHNMSKSSDYEVITNSSRRSFLKAIICSLRHAEKASTYVLTHFLNRIRFLLNLLYNSSSTVRSRSSYLPIVALTVLYPLIMLLIFHFLYMSSPLLILLKNLNLDLFLNYDDLNLFNLPSSYDAYINITDVYTFHHLLTRIILLPYTIFSLSLLILLCTLIYIEDLDYNLSKPIMLMSMSVIFLLLVDIVVSSQFLPAIDILQVLKSLIIYL